MKKALIIVITTTILTVANTFGNDFSSEGSVWSGGAFNFSSFGFQGGDTRINRIEISPILRFFPVDHLMIGPKFSWAGTFIDENGVNQFEMGLDIGAVFKIENKLYPYFRSGTSLALLSSGGNSFSGFTLPLAAGMLIPIGRIFALQIEPSYTITWIEGTSINTFNINFGICGIGKKSAVSISHGIINNMIN